MMSASLHSLPRVLLAGLMLFSFGLHGGAASVAKVEQAVVEWQTWPAASIQTQGAEASWGIEYHLGGDGANRAAPPCH
jgi:hypothetical protein